MTNFSLVPEPGDILTAAGGYKSSYIIKAATLSIVSHMAGVAMPKGISRPYVFECTSLDNLPCDLRGECVSGCQAHEFSKWLHAYDGKVWLYKQSIPLSSHQSAAMTEWLTRNMHHDFSFWYAARHVACPVYFAHNNKVSYCSKYVKGALTAAGRGPIKRLTPAGIIREGARTGMFQSPIRLK